MTSASVMTPATVTLRKFQFGSDPAFRWIKQERKEGQKLASYAQSTMDKTIIITDRYKKKIYKKREREREEGEERDGGWGGGGGEKEGYNTVRKTQQQTNKTRTNNNNKKRRYVKKKNQFRTLINKRRHFVTT